MHKWTVLETILKFTLMASHITTHRPILTTVTLVSTSNALPDDGVTVTPKHVGAVLM